VEVLPAVGGAVEDLERPDFEEREDQALNEGAKLMECPTVRDATLSLANRDPFADTLEIFPRPVSWAFTTRGAACCSSVGMSLTISARFMSLVYPRQLSGCHGRMETALPPRA